jgi:hypothetical protein
MPELSWVTVANWLVDHGSRILIIVIVAVAEGLLLVLLANPKTGMTADKAALDFT